MPTATDLKVVLTFCHKSGKIPSRDLARCLDHCEESIYISELDDISSLDGLDKKVSADLIKVMRFCLESRRGTLLNIGNASQGSIVLGGLAAAAAYWVIGKTLGETLKEAWKKSELHKKIMKFLLMRFQNKPKQIAEYMKRRIEEDEKLDMSVEVEISEPKDSFVTVSVRVTPKYEEHKIPLRADYIDGTDVKENECREGPSTDKM